MALLELRGVGKSFGALEVLSQIDLDVEAGKITSVIGPNGAGKTTLFNVISGRFPVSSGTILFKDRDIARLKEHEITLAGLARSFQITNIFQKLTVWENIFLAVQTRSPKRMSLFTRFQKIGRSQKPDRGDPETGRPRPMERCSGGPTQPWRSTPSGNRDDPGHRPGTPPLG